MFGRSRSSVARRAESAWKAGQLDDAFNLAVDPHAADDDRMRRLLSELCEPFLRRAQEHLLSERFSEALLDIDRAGRCGVMREKVEDWRQRALAAMQDRQAQHRRERRALEAAEQQVVNGQLTMARENLEAVGDRAEGALLAEKADRQAQRAQEALSDARTALKRGAIAEAVDRWSMARRDHAGNDELRAIEDEIVATGCSAIRSAMAEGRLDRARLILSQLRDLGRGGAERADLEQCMSLAARASSELVTGDHHAAIVALGRLAQLAPNWAWVTAARDHFRELESCRNALREGPLGFLAGDAPHNIPVAAVGDETVASPPGRRTAPQVAPRPVVGARFMLRIDGVGSYLLLRGDRVTVGRAGAGAFADLPLISDLPDHAADVIRSGDDYFFLAVNGASVGGREVRQALLSHGDELRLGRRARLRFLRPSLKSSTAVLELGAGVRTAADVRRVILFGGPILLGNTSECHILGPRNGCVLLEREGRMFVRTLPTAIGDSGGAMVPLETGRQTEIGDIRLSIQPWFGDDALARVGLS